ncbi:zinc finger BED domain-containing protein RICESLEEPER 2-like [Prunus avium]|uniref:Zinc finger BED domain-containing protein RICESLEEPER 2-like n=1 Tax=Prunus avium TaxID=42229 RepID=A0A6P5U264_PRUAV|nr:zinc finger BED domain-containing protein RICESLEEPER 2-like [Prunus avium]
MEVQSERAETQDEENETPKTQNEDKSSPAPMKMISTRQNQVSLNLMGIKRALANMIILHEYPLSLVDHIGFKIHSNTLQPLFKVCSRNTVKKDIFKIFEIERERTMKLLDTNKSKIAITTDMWTSNNQKRGFMTVTSHFIDDAWKLQSRLIRFIYVPCPHTADVLADALMECMYDWNFDNKLSYSSLMLDGRLFPMRCCAHILNLVVRDDLEVIKNSIEKIRYSVAFWLGTQKREEKFIETTKQLRVPTSKMLELDCKTRWNSTYSMLKTAMIYKDIFPRLKHREPLYKEVPSESDWVKTNELVDKLGIFYDVTLLFSETKYPTANLYFKNICAIRLAICDCLVSDQEDVKTIALQMQKKFEKYWDTMHGLMGVASILDPRYKMKQIEFLCPLIYGDNAAQEVFKYKNILYDLVKEYQSKSQQSHHVQHESSINNPLSRATMPKLDLVKQLDVFVSHSTTNTHVKYELDHYLDESHLPRNDDDDFEILCWWKSNGIKYPTLHDIARDILAIPVSTVASEYCFSTSGRIISPHHSRLHSKIVEALMCARDWLWN